MSLTLADVAQDPGIYRYQVISKKGTLTLRPLLSTDAVPLQQFLKNLSPETRKLSTFDSYDLVMAQELCSAINKYDKLRFVLTTSDDLIVGLLEFSFGLPESDLERFAAYCLALDPETDCRFGPTLADDYQDQGVGSQVLPLMAEIAKQFEKRRIILFGGVLAANTRAIHFYKKFGFREVGQFENSDNVKCLDMVLEV